VKFILVIIFSLSTYGQTPKELSELLNANLFKKYEKMFESMLDDMEKLDNKQLNYYNGAFEKNLLKQFQNFGMQYQSYKWKENSKERILEISGKMIEDEKANIEIKDGEIKIKATFEEVKTIGKSKSRSLRYLSLQIQIPKDCDETSVRFENKKKNFQMIFKKIKDSKNKLSNKPLRSPLKKQIGAPTI